jgi:hypothetical protein
MPDILFEAFGAEPEVFNIMKAEPVCRKRDAIWQLRASLKRLA